jgi:hypothetical protein
MLIDNVHSQIRGDGAALLSIAVRFVQIDGLISGRVNIHVHHLGVFL